MKRTITGSNLEHFLSARRRGRLHVAFALRRRQSKEASKNGKKAMNKFISAAALIATSSSDEKLKRVRALGADYTINYRHDPDWGALVREWTHGSGVDHVIEVGGPGTLAQSITAVAIGGHIALIGVLTGRAGERWQPAHAQIILGSIPEEFRGD